MDDVPEGQQPAIALEARVTSRDVAPQVLAQAAAWCARLAERKDKAGKPAPVLAHAFSRDRTLARDKKRGLPARVLTDVLIRRGPAPKDADDLLAEL